MAGQAETELPKDESITVPSGQEVRFLDVIQAEPGPAGLTVRFRFVAPAIAREGGSVGAEVAQADMEALCNDYALPRISALGPVPQQIIIVLSDREVPFGEPIPEATQYFEAYSFADGACFLEPF